MGQYEGSETDLRCHNELRVDRSHPHISQLPLQFRRLNKQLQGSAQLSRPRLSFWETAQNEFMVVEMSLSTVLIDHLSSTDKRSRASVTKDHLLAASRVCELDVLFLGDDTWPVLMPACRIFNPHDEL